jgi:hypothetical protein
MARRILQMLLVEEPTGRPQVKVVYDVQGEQQAVCADI